MSKKHRSAETGRYVTEKFAKNNPKTTVSERDKPKGGGEKGKGGKRK